MKMLFKLIVLFLLFIYSFLYFAPKQLAYNFIEQEALNHKVIISDEIKEEKAFSFLLRDANIYFDGLKVANFKRLNLQSLYFKSTFEINEIKLLKSLSKMFPSKIKNVQVKHSILDFDKLSILANGDFGVINGSFDIINRTLHLELKASKLMEKSYSKILRKMKKQKGVYIYEYKL